MTSYTLQPFLHQLIRNRDGMLGEFFTDFVPKMLDAYLETQDSVRQQMENFLVPTNWMDPTGEMKISIFDPFGAFKKKTGETSENSDPVNKNRDEVDELRMKLRELEERLNSIKTQSLDYGRRKYVFIRTEKMFMTLHLNETLN